MYYPESYIKDNAWQRQDAKELTNKYIKKMIWNPNEIVLDIGCGPGDVTADIIFPSLKNIKKLVGVDKSKEMIDYAKKNYACSNIEFQVLDITNKNDCINNLGNFNKIFSFYCLHWVTNKLEALVNVHSLLKSNGEVLFQFLLNIPNIELYKSMDAEWQRYIQISTQTIQNVSTQEEVRDIFIKAGFKILTIESNKQNYTCSNLSILLDTLKAVDDIYHILPSYLHDKYYIHAKEKLSKSPMVHICPTTGITTIEYLPIVVHAVKI